MRATCKEQERILQAAEEGALESGLGGHLASCPDCRQALALRAAFRDLAENPVVEPRLPRPEYVWAQALLQERLAAGRRRQKRLKWSRALALSIGIGLVAVTVFLAFSLVELASSSVPEGASDPASSIPFSPTVLLAAAGGLSLLAAFLKSILEE